MRKRTRAAVKAAQRKKVKKAYKERRVNKTLILDAIGWCLSEQAKLRVIDCEVDPGDRCLAVRFRVYVARDTAGMLWISHDVTIFVIADEDEGLIRVTTPVSLEGVPDRHRARLFENLLDANKVQPAGTQLLYMDDCCEPCIRLSLTERHVAEKAGGAVFGLLRFMVVYGASIERVLETGDWVEPEMPERGRQKLDRTTEEHARRIIQQEMDGVIEENDNVMFFAQGLLWSVTSMPDCDESEHLAGSLTAMSKGDLGSSSSW